MIIITILLYIYPKLSVTNVIISSHPQIHLLPIPQKDIQKSVQIRWAPNKVLLSTWELEGFDLDEPLGSSTNQPTPMSHHPPTPKFCIFNHWHPLTTSGASCNRRLRANGYTWRDAWESVEIMANLYMSSRLLGILWSAGQRKVRNPLTTESQWRYHRRLLKQSAMK